MAQGNILGKEANLEILKLLPKNAGTHNSIYRGKDITDLFYNGTLSKQIADATFDDIWIGDYIIGKISQRKYLVADLNYRFNTGKNRCITPHVLMIPERIMGRAKMNTSKTTDGAYINSDMYKTNLESYRETIRNDFGISHILKHQEHFMNMTMNGYTYSGMWVDSDVDLMNEPMVYGSYIYTPKTSISETNIIIPYLYTIDKSQLSLFRLRPDLIITAELDWYWLRDVVSSEYFADVGTENIAYRFFANETGGIRPAFLIY